MSSIWYLLANILRTYICYLFFMVFYEKRRSDKFKSTEFFLYASYYILTTVAYLYYKNVAFIIGVNAIVLTLIGLYYSRKFKYALVSMSFIYGTFFIIEILGLVISGFREFDFNSQALITNVLYHHILPLCMCLVFVLIAGKSRFVKYIKSTMLYGESKSKAINQLKRKKFQASGSNIFFIPFLSIVVIMLILPKQELLNGVKYSVVVALGTINIIAFHLFGALSQQNHERMQYLLLQKQNDGYINQIENMKKTNDKINRLDHDLRFYVKTIKDYVLRNDIDEVVNNLDKIIHCAKVIAPIASTGNIPVDATINQALTNYIEDKINLVTDIQIPVKFDRITSLDITILLYNLLDNAVNAVMKLSEGQREIEVILNYDKKMLYIEVKNSFNGVLNKNNKGLIETSHKDKQLHGYGLKSVQYTVEDYNGKFKIEYNGASFNTYMILHDY